MRAAGLQTAPAKQIAPALSARRVPLGPVPGFTLPSTALAAGETPFAVKGHRQSRGMLGAIGDWLAHLEQATGSTIKASGHNNLSMRVESVSGNADSYHQDQYYGQGSNGIYNDANMSVDATLFKYFHYSASINNSAFRNPNENRVKLDYNTPHTRLEVGDINAGFSGNSLIDFNRYLSGVKLTNVWSSKFDTSLLYSQTKAETRTITIPGNNSSGPYYVYAGQIVEGSDHVRVDNRDMIRGTDYTLDLFTGELQFTNGQIVLATQTIAVSFETLGYNQDQGTIYGIRAQYSPFKSTRLGVTYVQQTSSAPSGLQTRTQQFFGHVDPGQPYSLDEPVDTSKPITVSVGGIPLVLGVDYTVDAALTNEIRLKQSVSPNVIVQVQYVPLNVTPIPGNRNIMGLDGLIQLGGLGSVTLESAFSGLTVSGTNNAGAAYQVRADLNPTKYLHSNVILRDVSPTFSGIQNPGFNQNEKSFTLNTDYQPGRTVRLQFGYETAARPSYSGGFGINSFTPSTVGNDQYNQYNVGGTWQFGRNANLNFSRSSIGTNFAVGGFSNNTTDDVGLAYNWKSFSLTTDLSRYGTTASEYFTTTGTTPQLFDTNSTTFSKRVGLGWHPSSRLDLTTSYSDNSISSTTTGSPNTSTTARDAQFSARFNAGRGVRLNYTYQLSDTGTNGTTSGTNNTTGSVLDIVPRGVPLRWPYVTRDSSGTGTPPGFGTTLGGGANSGLGGFGSYSGYYGSGFSNGYGFSSFGGRTSSHRVGVDYALGSRLTAALNFDLSQSSGAYQYNSSRSGVEATMTWQPSSRFSVNTTFDVQKVAYTNGYGGTTSNVLMLWLQGHPFGGKLGTYLSWQQMLTGSTVTFTGTGSAPTPNLSTNMSSISARLDYPIAAREVLFMEYAGSTSSGFLASSDSNLRLGLDYSLTHTFKFSLGWQFLSRINADPTNAQYNYRVSSLLAELGLNFN